MLDIITLIIAFIVINKACQFACKHGDEIYFIQKSLYDAEKELEESERQ